jgi:hypothetical protein
MSCKPLEKHQHGKGLNVKENLVKVFTVRVVVYRFCQREVQDVIQITEKNIYFIRSLLLYWITLIL